MLQWHPPEGIRGKIFRLQLNRNIVSAVSQDLKGFEILLIFSCDYKSANGINKEKQHCIPIRKATII